MKNNLQLKKNINRNYIYTLLQNLDMTRGIWMIYLAAKGMSLTELGFLETIFHITSFMMEVPTGAVADLFGRRISRIMGRFFSLIGIILLVFSNSFLGFAISFIFSALSYNLESGAGDALIYDSLKELGEEKYYMRISGNKEMFYQIANTISFLVGGYLATKSYKIAFAVTIIIGGITIIQSFTFKEPGLVKKREARKKGNIFIAQLKGSLMAIKNNRKIGVLIIFIEILLAFCTCMFYYLQNYLKGNGYNEAKIGFIYAAASLSSAVIGTQVHKIDRRIKERGLLLITPVITVLCVWGAAISEYSAVFFILLTITEGIIYVASSDYINKMIPSESRATILSFASMVFSFFMITLFPLIGIIGDKCSLKTAFEYLGILGTALVVLNSYLLLGKRKKERA